MKDIPPDILTRFADVLKRRSIPAGIHQYYLKWLRYYLDYCSKYHLPEKASKSLTLFLLKLKEKKQTDAQQKQAGHAVSIFLDMEKSAAKLPPAGKAPAIVQPHPFNPLLSVEGQGFKAPKPTANGEKRPPSIPA